MIDEDFTKSLLEKHSYLTQRDSVDWLTVECAPEKLVSFVQSLRDLEGFEIFMKCLIFILYIDIIFFLLKGYPGMIKLLDKLQFKKSLLPI